MRSLALSPVEPEAVFVPPLPRSQAMHEAICRAEAAELRAEADRLFDAENAAMAAGDDTLAIDLQNEAWELVRKATALEFNTPVEAVTLAKVVQFGSAR